MNEEVDEVGEVDEGQGQGERETSAEDQFTRHFGQTGKHIGKRFDGLEDRVSEVEESQEDMESTLGEVGQQADENTSRCKSLRNDHEELEDTVSSLRDEGVQREGRINDVEQDVSENSSNIDENSDSIDGLEDDIDEVENDLGKLALGMGKALDGIDEDTFETGLGNELRGQIEQLEKGLNEELESLRERHDEELESLRERHERLKDLFGTVVGEMFDSSLKKNLIHTLTKSHEQETRERKLGLLEFAHGQDEVESELERLSDLSDKELKDNMAKVTKGDFYNFLDAEDQNYVDRGLDGVRSRISGALDRMKDDNQ